MSISSFVLKAVLELLDVLWVFDHGKNSLKFALSTICAEGVPSLLSLIFLLQYHLAITQDNHSRTAVPMTDSHSSDNGFTDFYSLARVDDAAVNIALVPEQNHAPEYETKSLI
jgi:hypothetical protein